MHQRAYSWAWKAALVLAAAGCGKPEAAPAGEATGPPLNLILISLDTCRADRLSCYEAGRPNTPNLDALAAEAALFTNCLAQSTATGPSHLSLFTGQYPHRHGVTVNSLAAQPSYTLASLLQERGYRTAGFTGGGYLREKYGLNFGFDAWLAKGGPKDQVKRTLGVVLPATEEWLDRHATEKFFLFWHGFDPHCPYTPPAPLRARYAGWYRGAVDVSGLCGKDDFQPLMADGSFGPEQQRALNDLYDAGVAAADETLGRLFARLRADGLLDRSIVVFVSDHGESLGEHGWVGHARMWEEQIRVPFLIRFPHGRYAGRYDDPVQLVDLLPTLCDALGLPLPEAAQGVNLMPRLRGGAPLDERLRLCRYGAWESVRFDRRWKLVWRNEDGAPREPELYDLEADPGELRNLYDTEEGRARFAERYARYQEWRRETQPGDQAVAARAHQVTATAEETRELEALGYVETGG